MGVKYTVLELLFANRWQWVRKRAKAFWVKDIRPDWHWIRFNSDEMELIESIHATFPPDKFLVEDWR